MSTNNTKKEDSRPKYIAPSAIRLDDIYRGAGGKCSIGSGIAAGDCNNGGGAGVQCETGNGAKVPCFVGNGDQA